MKRTVKIVILLFAFWQAFINPVSVSVLYAQTVTPSDSPTPTSLVSPSPADLPTDLPSVSPTSIASPASSSQGGPEPTAAGSSTAAPTVSPADSPTPTDSPTDSPSASPTGTVVADSAVLDPSATPSATPTTQSEPTAEAGTGISVDQSGTANSNTSSSSNTGSNSQNSMVNSTGSATMTTGEAVSTANSITVTNLSEVNSNLIIAVQNILNSDAPDINLYQALEAAIAVNPNFVPENTNITVNQTADTNSETQSSANSGSNNQSSDSAAMTTGDAVALVNAISAVNLNLVGANTVLTIINILADWNGNIILPNGSQLSAASLTSNNVNLTANQSGQATTTTQSSAVSGNNSQTGEDSTTTTGNAVSSANSTNLINVIQIGNGMGYLIINNGGNWSGNLINWLSPGSTQSFGTGSYALSETFQGTGNGSTGEAGTTNIISNQTANVETSVSANSNSGGNLQNGNSSALATGKSLSFANNFTLANITSVGSGFFFGIINILGSWTGNIVSGPLIKASAVTERTDPAIGPPSNPPPDTRTPDLQTSAWTNVGAFVHPGDTLLASITVNNTSPFSARNVEVLGKITNGNSAFDVPLDWKVGDLKAEGHVKISFNAALKTNLPNGMYHLEAQAMGQSDSGNTASSNLAVSNFLVMGAAPTYTASVPPVIGSTGTGGTPEVLGITAYKPQLDINTIYPYVFLFLSLVYLLIILARRRLNGKPTISPAFSGRLIAVISLIILFFRKGSS